MNALVFLLASIASVQAALQGNAAVAPNPNTQNLQSTRAAFQSQYMATATAPPEPQQVMNERQAHVSAFMATQTNSALASAYASALARKTVSPSAATTSTSGFGQKMKDFFKNMQVKVQKTSTASVVATSTAAIQPTTSV